jgi:hypothetical protein
MIPEGRMAKIEHVTLIGCRTRDDAGSIAD